MRNRILTNIVVILAGAWRRRYLIVVPILLMPFVALGIGLLMPQKYETNTTILVQEAARHNPFLEDLTVATDLKNRMAAINALLHSNHMLSEIAMSQGLISKDTPQSLQQIQIGKLSRSLKAKLVGEDLIKISYQSNHPEGMSELLKLVSLRFVERVIAPQRSTIYRSEEFLKTELKKRQTDLLEAEKSLAQYKSDHANELPKLHSSNANRLEQLKESLSERKRLRDSALASRESQRKKLSQTNPVVGRIEERIIQQLSELAILRARYTDRHTRVQAALQQLESLQNEQAKQVQATQELDISDINRLWDMASSQSVSQDGQQPLLISQLQQLQAADNQVESLEQEILSLSEEVLALEKRVNGYGVHEQKLTELKRDLTIKQKIYGELSERYQKARVTGALGRWEESERIKLIDPPMTPTIPSNLPLPLFAIAGLVAGISIGLGLALAIELMDTSIRYRSTLSTLTGVPVLGRIPPIPCSTPCPSPPEVPGTLRDPPCLPAGGLPTTDSPSTPRYSKEQQYG